MDNAGIAKTFREKNYMLINIYAVYDTVNKDTVNIFAAKTDGTAVRNNMPIIWSALPQKDTELYQIGIIDTEQMEISKGNILEPRLVNFNSYAFPEEKVKNLSKDVNSDIAEIQKDIDEVNEKTNKQAAAEARDMNNQEA